MFRQELFFYVKKLKLERLADSGVELYDIESKAA
jgi:hypothetical protein